MGILWLLESGLKGMYVRVITRKDNEAYLHNNYESYPHYMKLNDAHDVMTSHLPKLNQFL